MVKVFSDVYGKPLPAGMTKGIYLDGREKENLDALHKKRMKNWDVIGCVVGYEGDGKSVYAAQRCLYMDANFTLDNIVFNERQLEEAVLDTKKFPDGSAIMWDESDALGDHWASTIMRTLIKLFKRIRKRNLFVLLVTPTFFDFGKYFAIHRVQFMVHIHADGLTRGFFRFFNRSTKRELYIKGKQYWNMKAAMPRFRGRFSDTPTGFPIDFSNDGPYDKKKDAATAELTEESLSPQQLIINYRRKVIEGYDFVLNNKFNMSLSRSQHAEALNVSKATVVTDYKALKEGCN